MSDLRAGEMVLAGFWVRFAASILDAAWILPSSFLLALGGMALKGGDDLSPGADVLLNVIFGTIVVLFWVTRGATPGKWILGLRVVDGATGGVPPWPRLVLRYAGYLVSAVAFCLGYLWMIWNPRRRCWHDMMAGTLVIRVPR